MRSVSLAALCLTIALSASPALHAQASPSAAPKITYVKAGHLFDSAKGAYQQNAVLVIEGERIKSVEASGFAIPAGSSIVDLSADYVLPGLIDCHTHLSLAAPASYDPLLSFTRSPPTTMPSSTE